MIKDKIILDRAYAFYLLNYLSKLEKKEDVSSLYEEDQMSIINHTINAINWASILFKKILIEDYYASSLNHLIGNRKWFWDLFELYSPDKVISDNPELSLIIDDSIKLDMEDKNLKKVVKNNLPREYSEKERYSSLIWNINRTLQTAKTLDSVILPWPSKVQLYHYKFANTLMFEEKSKSSSVLKNVFDFQAPLFSIQRLEDLITIRSDPRVSSLRKLIWDLVNADNTETKEAILQKMEDEKSELVKRLAPSISGLIRALISSPIPFPFNLAVTRLYQSIDLQKIKPYEWYFLLIDLRNISKSKHEKEAYR